MTHVSVFGMWITTCKHIWSLTLRSCVLNSYACLGVSLYMFIELRKYEATWCWIEAVVSLHKSLHASSTPFTVKCINFITCVQKHSLNKFQLDLGIPLSRFFNYHDDWCDYSCCVYYYWHLKTLCCHNYNVYLQLPRATLPWDYLT